MYLSPRMGPALPSHPQHLCAPILHVYSMAAQLCELVQSCQYAFCCGHMHFLLHTMPVVCVACRDGSFGLCMQELITLRRLSSSCKCLPSGLVVMKPPPR